MKRTFCVINCLAVILCVGCQSTPPVVSPGPAPAPARAITQSDVDVISQYLRAHADRFRVLSKQGRPKQASPEYVALAQLAETSAKAVLPPEDRSKRFLPLIWTALIRNNVLHDGMPLVEAAKLLGEPTDKTGTDDRVHWYYNNRMHVIPNLSARQKDGTLSGFKVNKR